MYRNTKTQEYIRMVNIVINGDKKRVHINDIKKGIVISKDFKCSICDKSMSYVKDTEYEGKNNNMIFREAHFRHASKIEEGDCDKKRYKDYTKKDITNEYINKKSDFHKYWQDMFDTDNLEHKMVENGKTHYADIYIENDECINILTNDNEEIFITNPEKLVIEVQHSRISQEKIIERSNFYHNDEMKRELIWIFDLQDKCEINKIITFYETKYRLKILDHNEHDFQNVFKITNFKPIIMLDNNGKNVYYVRDIPRLDQDYLDVIPISRDNIINQLSKYVNKELKWEGNLKKNTIKIIDYESNVLKMKDIDDNKRNVMRYIFYILEYIKMDRLMNIYNLMEYLYMFLMEYSKNNEKIKELFKKYLFTHRIHYNSKIDGKGLAEIEFERLYNIYKRVKDVYELINYKKYDLNGALEFLYNKKRDKEEISDIKKNNDLYKDVFEYVRQRIEYYEDLDIDDYKIVDNDKLYFYKYLKNKLDIMGYNIDNNANIMYSINEEENIYKNINIEKIKLIKRECNNKSTICKFCYEDTEGVSVCNELLGLCNYCNMKNVNELNEMLKNKEFYKKMREKRIRIKEEKIRIREEEERKHYEKMEEEKRKRDEERKKEELERMKKKEEEMRRKEEEKKVEDERRKIEEENKKREEDEIMKKYEERKKEWKEERLMYQEEKYERDRLDKIKRAEEEKIIEKRRKESYNEKVDQNNMYKEDNRHIILKNNKEIEDKVNEKERVDKKYENHINMIKDEMKNNILKNDYKVIIKYKFLYETTIIECVKRANSFDNMINILYDINNKLGDDNVRKVDVYCNGLLIYDFNNMDECYKVINNMFVLKDVALTC